MNAGHGSGSPDRRILYFDVTKALRQGHSSGLNRVSRALREALATLPCIDLRPVRWSVLKGSYVETGSGRPVGVGNSREAFFTPETFALGERLFSTRWLERFRGRSGVVFYDAIPFFHPETTWPHSVRRFPKWFDGLSRYDHVFYISEQSREEAQSLCQRLGRPGLVGSLVLMGCDYQASPPAPVPGEGPTLLQVGIVEPRKGQDVLLDACERLWADGLKFRLVLLGRVNPHFGERIRQKIEALQRSGRDLVHEESAGDDRLAHWHARATLTVQPSRAEGFGLPVLESLWAGCPVVCSRQPCLECLPEQNGIEVLDTISTDLLETSLRSLLTNPESLEALRSAIRKQGLPTWKDSAVRLCQDLGLSPSS
jgi:glycosyltransferase involved in cell wall biosynthesis